MLNDIPPANPSARHTYKSKSRAISQPQPEIIQFGPKNNQTYKCHSPAVGQVGKYRVHHRRFREMSRSITVQKPLFQSKECDGQQSEQQKL